MARIPFDEALDRLAALLTDERDRLARRWAKRVREETYEIDVPGREVRAPLDGILGELARLLRDRGEDALRLWPEAVRSHGARRYDMHFEAEDVAREFKALNGVLLDVYARAHGEVPLEVATLIAELVGEGLASVQASFARALRTEEVRFREAAVMESVLLHVEVGIMLAESDGTITFATPPVTRLLGVPLRPVLGARDAAPLGPLLQQLKARHPGGAPFKLQDMPFLQALRTRAPVRGIVMELERPAGGPAVLELSATPVWEEGAGPGQDALAGVLQTFTDRTESAAQSRALLNAQDELRRLQGRLLQRTRTQALGQLAQGAAHALNNFLNVLQLRSTVMRREGRPEQLPEHLDALDRTVQQMGELVARLQEFGVHRGEDHLSDVEVDDTAREALELARAELGRPERPVAVELRLGAPPRVRVDKGAFRELLVNLLLAARDRMPEGGRVVLATRAGSDGRVELHLSDAGPALSDEELGRLFDPLNRHAGAPHLSLLLAVARNQVQRWGGMLDVERGRDGGGVFVVRLPPAREEAAEAPVPALPQAAAALAPPTPPRAHAPAAAAATRARRVLVVDDDADNARMLGEVLAEEGYEVQVAYGAETALQLWEAQPFDAALLDAVMPEVSGFELARELRRRTPQALLAIVTGMDVRGQNRANLALVDALFHKPVDVAALDDFLHQPTH